MQCKLYSFEEMMADICQFEKVQLAPTPHEKFSFTKLYSEIYVTRLPQGTSVEVIVERFRRIVVNEFKTMLPEVDRQPDSTDMFTVYVSDTFYKGEDHDLAIKYYKGYKVRDDVVEVFEQDEFPVFLVVDHETKTVHNFTRSAH